MCQICNALKRQVFCNVTYNFCGAFVDGLWMANGRFVVVLVDLLEGKIA